MMLLRVEAFSTANILALRFFNVVMGEMHGRNASIHFQYVYTSTLALTLALGSALALT